MLSFEELKERIDGMSADDIHAMGKVVGPSVFGGLTALLVSWRARRAWLQRQFASRLNISLTTVNTKGELRLRTLKETALNKIMPSHYGSKELIKQAKLYESTDTPQLVAAPRISSKLTQIAMINAVSELSGFAYLSHDIGASILCAPYSFGLVYEDGLEGGYKLRLVVASLSTLRNAVFIARNKAPIHYEARIHDRRFQTLLLMHKALTDQGLDLSGPTSYQKAISQLRNGNDAAWVFSSSPYTEPQGIHDEDCGVVPVLGVLELCTTATTSSTSCTSPLEL